MNRLSIKKLNVILLTSVFISACSSSTNNKNTNIVEDKFTWNVQLASYDYSKYDEKGEITLEKFLVEFENFPWIEQLEKYNEIKKGCSPTLSVKDNKTGTDFWVSMLGDKDENGYLVGYVYPKKVKGFLGFGKSKEKRWVEIYLTQDVEIVKQCFALFFNRETEKLITTISFIFAL